MDNEIDWSKAPEGTTHCVEGFWYRKMIDCLYIFTKDNSWSVSMLTEQEFKEFKPVSRYDTNPADTFKSTIKLETLVPPVVITLQDKEQVQSLLNALQCALNAQESDNYVDGVDKDTAIEIQEYLEKVLNEHK